MTTDVLSIQAPRRASALRRLALVAVGALLDLLWLPPGVLGVHLPWLVFVADAPFLLLLWEGDRLHWKRWALLYGLVRFGVGLSWLGEVGLLQHVGAAVVLAPVYVLLGAVLRLGVRARLPFLPLVGLGVVLEELLRTVWMGGMPWPQRSLAFTGWPTLCASAALAGAYGLSFLAGMTSALALGLWGLVRAVPAVRPQIALRLLLASLAPALWAGLLLLHGQERLAHQQWAVVRGEAALTPPLLVVQAAIPQDLKHDRGSQTANAIFDRHTLLTAAALSEAAERRTRVLGVLWPETMVPWPFLSTELLQRFPKAWTNQLAVLSRLRASVPAELALPGEARFPRFFVGAIYHQEEFAGEALEYPDQYPDYDSLLALDVGRAPEFSEPPPPPPVVGAAPPAWLLGRHDKVVRVPGGEYTPLGDWLPPLRVFRNALSEVPEIARGATRQEPFLLHHWTQFDRGGRATVHPVKAGTVICFELAFPARCRAWRRAGCQVLFNAANYGWFGRTSFRAQIRAVGALRAAELGQTVVMAGNTGPSLFLDPVGRPYGAFHAHALPAQGVDPAPSGTRSPELDLAPGADGSTFQTGWVLEHLVADDTVTLYAAWGDWPWFLLGGLQGLLLLLALRRRV